MNLHLRLSLFVSLLAASTTLTGQSVSFTAPSGFLGQSGEGRHGIWGYYMDSRLQFADPSLPQRKLNLTALSLRTQTQVSYSPSLGAGRSFSSVTLTLGHGDCSKFTRTWTSNYKSVGSQVYSGRLSLKGYVSGRPVQAWGNVARLSFARSFAFDGSSDLITDWTFAGGRLDNNLNVVGQFYLTDGMSLQTARIVGPGTSSEGFSWLPRAPNTGTTCRDTGLTLGDAYASIQAVFHADNHSTTSLRGRVLVRDASVYATQKNANVLSALTLFGSDTGVVVPGARCNRLHVNMGIPLAVTTRIADLGGTSKSHLPVTPVKYDSSLAEAPLYFQAAWTDSNGQLGLSKACKLVLPRKPGDIPQGCLLYEFKNGSSTIGPVGPARSVSVNMLERFDAR